LWKWGWHWSMYNFNYEYMTFLYVVHVYMFCNVVLYCIALPHSLWCLGIFLYLPSSISNGWSLVLNLVKSCRLLIFFVSFK
jgi:hypothetical protein